MLNHTDINKCQWKEEIFGLKSLTSLIPLKSQNLEQSRELYEVKLKLLESTLKKKIDEEEKATGINSIGVSNIKIAVYEDTEKTAAAIHEYSNSSKVNVEKEKAEEL